MFNFYILKYFLDFSPKNMPNYSSSSSPQWYIKFVCKFFILNFCCRSVWNIYCIFNKSIYLGATTDTGSTIKLLDRADFQLQNSIFLYSPHHYWIYVFSPVMNKILCIAIQNVDGYPPATYKYLANGNEYQ